MNSKVKLNKNIDGSMEIVKTITEIVNQEDIERRYFRLRDLIRNQENQIKELNRINNEYKNEMDQIKLMIGENALL